MHYEGNGSASWEKKKNTFQGRPFFPCCLRIELVASLHYTFSILQEIELKHPLSSETLLSLRSGRGMAMNNYARDGAPKWPQIFISAHGARRRQKGSGSRGPSASTVMYHTALRVLTVQLGALLRPGPVSGGRPAESRTRSRAASSNTLQQPGPSISLTVTGRVAEGAGPARRRGPGS